MTCLYTQLEALNLRGGGLKLKQWAGEFFVVATISFIFWEMLLVTFNQLVGLILGKIHWYIVGMIDCRFTKLCRECQENHLTETRLVNLT